MIVFPGAGTEERRSLPLAEVIETYGPTGADLVELDRDTIVFSGIVALDAVTVDFDFECVFVDLGVGGGSRGWQKTSCVGFRMPRNRFW